MDIFVANLAETYIRKLGNREVGNVEFVEFKMDANLENTIGMHSDGVSGEIIYKADGNYCKSERVFVKYVSTENQTHKHRPYVVTMFDKEIQFYTQVVPYLNSLRSIDHLIPSFLDCKKQTHRGDTIAIMFRRFGSEWVCNNYESYLDYPHLSLMMRKLGEFHAYSFAAKRQDESQFLKLSTFRDDCCSVALQFVGPRLKPTLERCVQPIRNDQRYAEAISRLENLTQNLGDFLGRTYASSPNDPNCVLGHLSFNQSNVLFSYANRTPTDMKIMDWQTSSLGSLGIDLISILYVDATRQTRDEYWDRLLDEYHDSLMKTFGDVQVPSRDQIPGELKKAVGAAIFTAIYRATSLNVKISAHVTQSKALWNDEFVTEMLKDMIDRGFL